MTTSFYAYVRWIKLLLAGLFLFHLASLTRAWQKHQFCQKQKHSTGLPWKSRRALEKSALTSVSLVFLGKAVSCSIVVVSTASDVTFHCSRIYLRASELEEKFPWSKLGSLLFYREKEKEGRRGGIKLEVGGRRPKGRRCHMSAWVTDYLLLRLQPRPDKTSTRFMFTFM